MSRLWSYFSKIIIITIPNSDQNRIKKQLKFIGMDNYEIRVFKPAKKTSNNCGGKNSISLKQLLKHEVCDTTCQNIANNHFTIIQEAFDNNYENILIMEDDVIFQSITDHNYLKQSLGYPHIIGIFFILGIVLGQYYSQFQFIQIFSKYLPLCSVTVMHCLIKV